MWDIADLQMWCKVELWMVPVEGETAFDALSDTGSEIFFVYSYTWLNSATIGCHISLINNITVL